MKDEKIIDISLKERIRLDKSYINYHDIIDKNLPYKFAYLDEWLLKNSKLLLSEANKFESKSKQMYKAYKRGTIIRADFGVNIGPKCLKCILRLYLIIMIIPKIMF